MNAQFKKELPTILAFLAPFIYLMTIYNSLPAKVPMHWNGDFQIDGWGEKSSLIFLSLFLPGISYLLMEIVPAIDPKKKLDLMGGKLNQLKFGLVAMMSLLAIIIIYSAQKQSMENSALLFVPIGLLFMIFGNFFKTIHSNYFIGIKTPWTLDSEHVWKVTHILGGKIWLFGGLIIVISSFCLNNDYSKYVFFTTTTIIVLVPVIYSYIASKEEKATSKLT